MQTQKSIDNNQITPTLDRQIDEITAVVSLWRLITYFYPLSLLHFLTSYYMNMDMGSQQRLRYKINHASKRASTNCKRLNPIVKIEQRI